MKWHQSSTLKVIRYKRSQRKKPGASCPVLCKEKDTFPPKLGRETKSILRFLTGEKIKRALSERHGRLRKKHKPTALQVHPFILLLPTESTWAWGWVHATQRPNFSHWAKASGTAVARESEKPQENVEHFPRASVPLEDF